MRHSLNILREKYGNEIDEMVDILLGLALVYFNQKRSAELRSVCEEILAIPEYIVGSEDSRRIIAFVLLRLHERKGT